MTLESNSSLARCTSRHRFVLPRLSRFSLPVGTALVKAVVCSSSSRLRQIIIFSRGQCIYCTQCSERILMVHYYLFIELRLSLRTSSCITVTYQLLACTSLVACLRRCIIISFLARPMRSSFHNSCLNGVGQLDFIVRYLLLIGSGFDLAAQIICECLTCVPLDHLSV